MKTHKCKSCGWGPEFVEDHEECGPDGQITKMWYARCYGCRRIAGVRDSIASAAQAWNEDMEWQLESK